MHGISKRNREAAIRKISCLRECINGKKKSLLTLGRTLRESQKAVAELKMPKNHKIVCEFRLWVSPSHKS